MKLVYTGKQQELTPPQQRKVDARAVKLSKLLLEKGRGEKDGHVVLSKERHLHHAELTVRFFDHPLAALGTATDQFTAILNALDKVEHQLLKFRARWRDTKRTMESKAGGEPAPVFRKVRMKPPRQDEARRPNGKPMTLEEAVMSFDEEQDYMVFRDADSEKTSVLVRRRDGKLDLIQP